MQSHLLSRRCLRSAAKVVEDLESRLLFSTLMINGTPGDDTIVLDNAADGTVVVTLNGVTTDYPLAPLLVNTGAGNDTVVIKSVRANAQIVNGGGQDLVNVGQGDVSSLLAGITIGSLRAGVGSGSTDVVIDGSQSARLNRVLLTATAPVGPADNPFGTVHFSLGNQDFGEPIAFDATQISSVTIDGGSMGNFFTVDGAPTGPSITLNTGAGDDMITVAQTDAGSTVAINGQGGNDTLTIAPFDAAGGNVAFDGGAGDNRLVIVGAVLGDFGPNTLPSGLPPIILTPGQVKRADATVTYSNTQTLQVENGDFQVNGNLNGITLVVGSQTYLYNLVTVEINVDQTLGALDAESGQTTIAGHALLSTDSLTTPLGRIDVGLGQLTLHYGAVDPLSQTGQLIPWKIGTSAAANPRMRLGYADSADGVVQGLAEHTIIFRAALAGDINLDGRVDFTDLLRFAQVLRKHVRPTWVNGNFLGESVVFFDDLLLLAQNYGQSFPIPGAASAPLIVAAAETPLAKQAVSGGSEAFVKPRANPTAFERR